WRAIAADKRPPVSDAQVKANGGKRAVDALVSEPDRLAGEAVTAAAVEKIMAATIAKKTADKVATELMGTPVEKLAVEIAERATQRLVKALDTTEDVNGLPVFLKREGHETPKQR